jgi:hypothetical protein
VAFTGVLRKRVPNGDGRERVPEADDLVETHLVPALDRVRARDAMLADAYLDPGHKRHAEAARAMRDELAHVPGAVIAELVPPKVIGEKREDDERYVLGNKLFHRTVGPRSSIDGKSGRTLEKQEAVHPAEKKAADARMKAGVTPSGKFPEAQPGRSRDAVAAYVGKSGRTLEKQVAVVRAARERMSKGAKGRNVSGPSDVRDAADAFLAHPDIALPLKLRAAWREHGVLSVRVTGRRLTEHEQLVLAAIGERLHGDRKSA